LANGTAKLLFGLAFLLLFLVITVFVFSGVIQNPDAQLALAINNAYLGSASTELMVLFAEFGREYFWVPVVGVMLLVGNRDTKLLAIELTALFVVGILAGEIMKFVAYRARPYEVIGGIVRRLPVGTDSSYPSGHALIVSIGAAFALTKFRNRAVASLLAIEAAIVCYSRVYVGMHYPLDVAGGIFLAIGIVGVGLFIFERYLQQFLKNLASIAVMMLRDGPLKLQSLPTTSRSSPFLLAQIPSRLRDSAQDNFISQFG
jgi:membrane-associated phospholipid phosphatase